MPRISGLQDSRLENWKPALRFGTWNIRTLFKPDAFRTSVDEVENYRLGIVALQEIRRSDSGSIQLKNTALFYGACDNKIKTQIFNSFLKRFPVHIYSGLAANWNKPSDSNANIWIDHLPGICPTGKTRLDD